MFFETNLLSVIHRIVWFNIFVYISKIIHCYNSCDTSITSTTVTNNKNRNNYKRHNDFNAYYYIWSLKPTNSTSSASRRLVQEREKLTTRLILKILKIKKIKIILST